MTRTLAGLVLAALTACGDDVPATAPDAPRSDAAIDAALPDARAPLAWESVEPISDDGSVIVERVAYRSEGLRIYARICRPSDGAPRPILVYNHGGFLGLDLDPEVARCRMTAELGYVWLGSSYRGEDGSDGQVEICLGEVIDVIEMIRIARAQPYAMNEVAMYGGSHGGCITVRAMQRGVPIVAAVDLFGPTDWRQLHEHWVANPSSATDELRAYLEARIGGPPSTHLAGYLARSPTNFVADEPVAAPLLVAHGTADLIVPARQACLLPTFVPFDSWHVSAGNAELPTAPAGCEGTGVPSLATPRPSPAWPGARYLVVYDGVGHETSSQAAQAMMSDAATFLMAKL